MQTDHVHKPKPPKLSHLFAVLLELGLVAVLIHEQSVVGLLIAAVYSWYSATWALVVGTKEPDNLA